MPDNRVEKIMQRLQIMSHNFHDDTKTSARNYIKYEMIIVNRAVSNMKVISAVICTLVILVHHYNAEETVSTGCQLL